MKSLLSRRVARVVASAVILASVSGVGGALAASAGAPANGGSNFPTIRVPVPGGGDARGDSSTNL